ncbi:unnamed protein product [Urochloa humidicola]
MGKPGALGLLRSCLFFPRRNNNLAAAGEDVASVSVSLPEDIIFEVLSRLPVRTLCRLRCVSKAWRALISDPAFAAAQGSRAAAAAAAPVVAGVFGKPSRFVDSYPLPPRPLELRVIDTADGAVLRVVKDVRSTYLMRARLDLVLIDQGTHGARVIDPASGRVVVLVLGARLPGEQANPLDEDMSIPLRGMLPCHYSFGRAAPSGVYKVLRLSDAVPPADGDDGIFQVCHVATLENGATMTTAEPLWRQRSEPPVLTCNYCTDCAAVVDGVLHFMDRGRGRGRGAFISKHGRRPGSTGWNRIAGFDLESEEWKMVIDGPPVTECPKEESWEMVLAELKGTLSVVQTVSSSSGHSDSTNIWFLVDPNKIRMGQGVYNTEAH